MRDDQSWHQFEAADGTQVFVVKPDLMAQVLDALAKVGIDKFAITENPA